MLFLTDYDPPAAGRRRLVRVHDGRQVSTILEGVVWSVLFQGERTFARVGADGTQLVSLDLDRAATRPVATLPPDVQWVRVTPDGTGLVAVAGPANPATAPGVPWRIQRLRFDQPARVATTTIPDSVGRFVSAPVLLADGGALVAVSGLERESYALFDPELQLVRRWDDTVGVSRLRVRDGTVVGLGHDTGRWYALDLAAGRFEPVFSFEPFLPQAVLTVDGPVPQPDLPMPAGPAVYRPDPDLAEPAGPSVQRSHPAGSASSGDTGGPRLVLPAALAAGAVAAAVAAGAAVRRRRSAG